LRALLAVRRALVAASRSRSTSARKAESERAELEREVERYESRIAKLEALQKVAVLEADADLRAKAEQLARKQAELLEVSTPVLAVWDGLVVAPMIGRVDAARARHLQEGLLAAVRERRARQAIVDLTGVREVALETADSLL
jgi:rsbT co-antagonist protein RsbR